MPTWLYALLYLLIENYSTRRDAQIRFLKAEVQILRKKLNRNRIVLSPQERSQLLSIGSELGHKIKHIIGIVTYQTYRRWVQLYVEGRIPKKLGRPRLSEKLKLLIIRIGKENIQWGYRRIVGELRKLNVQVSKSTVSRILAQEGIFPDPIQMKSLYAESPWRSFIKIHLNTLVACDFFTKTILTPLGKKTAYCLFFIHLGSRKVYITPSTYNPGEQWVIHQTLHFLKWCRAHEIQLEYLIHDRDTKFSAGFDRIFKVRQRKVIKTPFMAPNANAYAESWVATIKRECLEYFACFSLTHLNHITTEYTRFYNENRPHQRMDNLPLNFPSELHDQRDDVGRIKCRRHLGGLLKHYYREAA